MIFLGGLWLVFPRHPWRGNRNEGCDSIKEKDMGIFEKRLDMYEIQKMADDIFPFTMKAIGIFHEVLFENINLILKIKPELKKKSIKKSKAVSVDERIVKQLDDLMKNMPGSRLSIENRNRIHICAFTVWAIGAYMNGQKLLAKKDQIRLLDIINGKICNSEERDYYNSCFQSILTMESNPPLLAYRQIESILLNSDLIDISLPGDYLRQVKQHFIPLFELLSGCIGAGIDKLIKPTNYANTKSDVIEYKKEIGNTFINLDKMLNILNT